MAKILLVEDEAALVTMLRYNLEREGFEVKHIDDGKKALEEVSNYLPDIILLDWMLPSMSGVEVCKQIRRRHETRNVPVIMLTARGEESDKIQGLSMGADDYVTKPFSVPELVARIKAQLRRMGPSKAQGTLEFEDITMDLSAHRVERDGNVIHLGPTEFRLLKFLMENPGHVFSRNELLASVWGEGIHVEPRTVDVHVRRLRRVLNEGDKPDFIRTVRAAGYSLDASYSPD